MSAPVQRIRGAADLMRARASWPGWDPTTLANLLQAIADDLEKRGVTARLRQAEKEALRVADYLGVPR